eukprot:gnl/TRDRNA2_/TRDRNA2_186240_c0_seq1.p1 gnl/TRDRNA2_/TRDRNA2_186240_c0~~gnl/TRDRNA2_/TRDRNA2_186240_c0_seq1.p1  ORF type:complete len:693 (+),score=152.36 gnl/TRDRNA2_/TRDRNA2_186240_c0_seq1:25-2103(+)
MLRFLDGERRAAAAAAASTGSSLLLTRRQRPSAQADEEERPPSSDESDDSEESESPLPAVRSGRSRWGSRVQGAGARTRKRRRCIVLDSDDEDLPAAGSPPRPPPQQSQPTWSAPPKAAPAQAAVGETVPAKPAAMGILAFLSMSRTEGRTLASSPAAARVPRVDRQAAAPQLAATPTASPQSQAEAAALAEELFGAHDVVVENEVVENNSCAPLGEAARELPLAKVDQSTHVSTTEMDILQVVSKQQESDCEEVEDDDDEDDDWVEVEESDDDDEVVATANRVAPKSERRRPRAEPQHTIKTGACVSFSAFNMQFVERRKAIAKQVEASQQQVKKLKEEPTGTAPPCQLKVEAAASPPMKVEPSCSAPTAASNAKAAKDRLQMSLDLAWLEEMADTGCKAEPSECQSGEAPRTAAKPEAGLESCEEELNHVVCGGSLDAAADDEARQSLRAAALERHRALLHFSTQRRKKPSWRKPWPPPALMRQHVIATMLPRPGSASADSTGVAAGKHTAPTPADAAQQAMTATKEEVAASSGGGRSDTHSLVSPHACTPPTRVSPLKRGNGFDDMSPPAAWSSVGTSEATPGTNVSVSEAAHAPACSLATPARQSAATMQEWTPDSIQPPGVTAGSSALLKRVKRRQSCANRELVEGEEDFERQKFADSDEAPSASCLHGLPKPELLRLAGQLERRFL